MASSSMRREAPGMPHQRADTTTTTSAVSMTSPRVSARHQLTLRGNSDAGNGSSKARGSGTTRVPTRTNKHGVERPEHPLSSLSRAAAEEGGGAPAAGGDGGSSFALGAASRGGYRRNLSEISSGHSDQNADRRISHGRDPLRRSRDTNVSDTASVVAERGGHGRDGPIIPRETTASGAAAGAAGASRAGVGVERERSSGFRIGDEEIAMEVPGRYERMRVLGRGSFGAVTLVKDHRDSKLYAMKTLNCADKLEERQTAMAEVRLLKWLKHPSILMLFDTFLSTDGRLVCLTTTYCESGDLAKIVKHASKTKALLGEKTVLGWFAQLCLGVHHLHEEKKVLHRDIKPNNVFLMDSKKIVQLGDFGLAKVLSDGDKQVKAEVGTPYYTSPEMCNNQPYGFPSDVWSLGIVLFELLSLDVPFRSRDVVALVSQVIKAPPPPLPEVYSDEATALARWMLQKDPQRRPTLTQVLSCQPLRRHMSSFVKNYRPMNMAERQRRHDIRDLEAQVATIIERGGDDPQIPGDVEDGCGTLSTGALDEATTAHPAADAKNLQSLEARGGEASAAGAGAGPAGMGGGEGAAGGGGGGGGGAGGFGRARSTDGTLKSLSLAGVIPEGPAITTRVDGYEAATGGEGGGPCTRCGVRMTCVCPGGGGGGFGGGGNTTPGRRFGSPQQSKGVRHVMSWAAMSGPAAAPKEPRSATPVSSDDGSDAQRISGEFELDGGGGRGRRERRTNGSLSSLESELESESESFECHDSEKRGGRRKGSDGGGGAGGGREAAAVVGCGSEKKHNNQKKIGLRRKRSSDGNSHGNGNGSDKDDDCARSVDSAGNPSDERGAERPSPPRSQRSHSSARLKKRLSGGGGGGGGSSAPGVNRGRERVQRESVGGTNHPEGSKALPRRRRSSSDGGGGTTRGNPPPQSDVAAKKAVAGRLRSLPAGPDTATRKSASEGRVCKEGSETTGERVGMAAAAAAAAAATGEAAVGEAAAAANKDSSAVDRLGASLRPSPLSPRLTGSGSETFKTAKRLSEALTFAASGTGSSSSNHGATGGEAGQQSPPPPLADAGAGATSTAKRATDEYGVTTGKSTTRRRKSSGAAAAAARRTSSSSRDTTTNAQGGGDSKRRSSREALGRDAVGRRSSSSLSHNNSSSGGGGGGGDPATTTTSSSRKRDSRSSLFRRESSSSSTKAAAAASSSSKSPLKSPLKSPSKKPIAEEAGQKQHAAQGGVAAPRRDEEKHGGGGDDDGLRRSMPLQATEREGTGTGTGALAVTTSEKNGEAGGKPNGGAAPAGIPNKA